jgi:hypothetical protein
VNTTCFSRIGVCDLPMNEGRQRACAKSQPQRCGGNIRKRYLLSEYDSYNCVRSSICTVRSVIIYLSQYSLQLELSSTDCGSYL